MNTKLVTVIAIILLFLSFTQVSLSLPLVNETANPAEPDEESGTMFTSTNNTLNENFTIIVLPDTQGYTQIYPWLFDNQTQWIVDNEEELNIVFVSQLGDLVNIVDNITQWENANRSLSKLDGNVAWAVLPGNHDQVDGNYTIYSSYFGWDRFSDESWYGGAYETGDNTNSYQLFSAGGDDYLIFHLQHDPSNGVLFWASIVIDQYPDRRVIVSTHDFINGPCDPDYRSDIGERIWYTLITQHADQIFLVLCGHASTQSTLIDTVNGQVVYQLLADYQNSSNIESAWLRILTFCPTQDKIYVKTYSPYLDEYRTDTENEFTLDYKMTGGSTSVLSNFTVSQISFDHPSNQIIFEVSGETSVLGYCNVTAPKALIKGDPWTVTIDDEVWSCTSSENTTHSSIYFIYTCSSTSQVVIEGTYSIPEFPSILVLSLLMVATTFAVLFYRRKN